MATTESDIRCYELIDKYFEYNDQNLIQEMQNRLSFDENWESIPEEHRKRILAVDETVQAKYARWFNFGVFNQYMAILLARLRQAGIETAKQNEEPIPHLKTHEYAYPQDNYRNPRFTKKQIEYFRIRTEAYLSIWENATHEDLLVYDWENRGSAATARSALQRVFWGNHLQDGQIFRLVSTDLKWFIHPAYRDIHSAYHKPIKELLDFYDIYYLYREQNTYELSDYQPDEPDIDYFLDQWDWVSYNWQDEEENEEQSERSLSSRWSLHCAYKNGYLSAENIQILIALDKVAMLSDNYRLFSRNERAFIHSFLLEQGVFDKMPE